MLLDSGTTEMFMDRKMAARHGFRLQKLERPVVVRNINRTNNSTGTIIYQVKVNIYYKNHIEDMSGYLQFGKNKCYIGYTMVTDPLPRDKLGNKRSQNNEVSTNLQKEYSRKGRY